MELPVGQWLQIVAYRDFHDFPRLILARDETGASWLFDCPFDSALDDYRPDFRVLAFGDDGEAALAHFRAAVEPGLDALLPESVDVGRFRFDESRRSAVWIDASS